MLGYDFVASWGPILAPLRQRSPHPSEMIPTASGDHFGIVKVHFGHCISGQLGWAGRTDLSQGL